MCYGGAALLITRYAADLVHIDTDTQAVPIHIIRSQQANICRDKYCIFSPNQNTAAGTMQHWILHFGSMCAGSLHILIHVELLHIVRVTI